MSDLDFAESALLTIRRLKGLIGQLTFALDTTTQLIGVNDLDKDIVATFRDRNRALCIKGANEARTQL